MSAPDARASLAAPTRLITSIAICCSLAQSAQAQFSVQPSDRTFWIGSALLIASGIALDDPLRRAATANQSRALNHLAADVDPLGRAGVLVPALVASYVVPRVAGKKTLADAMLRVGLGYATADAIEAALKPLVGRHRPEGPGGAWRFDPLNTSDEWHSFPSAHTVHAFSIAAGISEEAQNRAVSIASYGIATLVGTQRIYLRAHWASDVMASTVLAIAASKTVVRWLHRRDAQ